MPGRTGRRAKSRSSCQGGALGQRVLILTHGVPGCSVGDTNPPELFSVCQNPGLWRWWSHTQIKIPALLSSQNFVFPGSAIFWCLTQHLLLPDPAQLYSGTSSPGFTCSEFSRPEFSLGTQHLININPLLTDTAQKGKSEGFLGSKAPAVLGALCHSPGICLSKQQPQSVRPEGDPEYSQGQRVLAQPFQAGKWKTRVCLGRDRPWIEFCMYKKMLAGTGWSLTSPTILFCDYENDKGIFIVLRQWCWIWTDLKQRHHHPENAACIWQTSAISALFLFTFPEIKLSESGF